MSLELAAMRWLWIEQKCLVVLEERTPKYGMGQPDVLGVTPGRYLTEIEVKRSVADFRADAKKIHRMVRNDIHEVNPSRFPITINLASHPRQFYYMMPPDLGAKLLPEIPEWAGLMVQRREYSLVDVLKRAPVNKESAKLTVKQCARLARMMTAHVMGYAIANNSIKETWKNGVNFDFTDWVEAKSGTYQI